MAMKIYEVRGAPITMNIKSIWDGKFIFFHQNLVLEKDTILEFKKGLEVCRLLQLPGNLTCNYLHWIDLLGVHDDRTLRPFSHLS